MLDTALSTPSPRAKSSFRRRLWKAGGLVAAFIFTMAVANCFLPPARAVTADMLGHDFLAFYFGGTCVRTGHSERLYDLPVTRAFEFKTGHEAKLSMGTSFGPWWNPPFAAWMFAPLSALPYMTALHLWWSIGLACLAVSIFLMCKMVPGGWKNQLLVPLFILTAMPCYQVFCHGQNTYVSLLMLTATIVLWRARQSFLAGMVCGLLFYKPQLGAVVALVLCASQGRRALLGVVLTGAALVLINMFTLPGTIQAFAFRMPGNLHWIQDQMQYRWERHVTFKAFWRLALQGWKIGPPSLSVYALWGFCEIALLAALAAAAWKTFRAEKSASRTDRLIAASIVCMPLLMPFYFDYDLLLISVAVVLYAVDRLRYPVARAQLNWEDRWLPRVWITLFLIQECTMLFAKARIHPAVPLITLAAICMVRRALRPQPLAATLSPPLPQDAPRSLAA